MIRYSCFIDKVYPRYFQYFTGFIVFPRSQYPDYISHITGCFATYLFYRYQSTSIRVKIQCLIFHGSVLSKVINIRTIHTTCWCYPAGSGDRQYKYQVTACVPQEENFTAMALLLLIPITPSILLKYDCLLCGCLIHSLRSHRTCSVGLSVSCGSK